MAEEETVLVPGLRYSDAPWREPSLGTLIVGASGGIGQAVARRVAVQPWCGRLVLAGVHTDEARILATQLTGSGAIAEAIHVDISDSDSIDRLAASVGPIDQLAIVSGRESVAPLFGTTATSFEETLRANLIGPYLTAQVFARGMVDRGRGSIVAITSTAGRLPTRDAPAYSAAKAGLWMALRVLGWEVLESGVRINALAPGPTDTEMAKRFRELRGLPARTASERESLIPPDKIAAAVAFLLSPDAEAVAIQELVVDGGRTLGAS